MAEVENEAVPSSLVHKFTLGLKQVLHLMMSLVVYVFAVYLLGLLHILGLLVIYYRVRATVHSCVSSNV